MFYFFKKKKLFTCLHVAKCSPDKLVPVVIVTARKSINQYAPANHSPESNRAVVYTGSKLSIDRSNCPIWEKKKTVSTYRGVAIDITPRGLTIDEVSIRGFRCFYRKKSSKNNTH